MICDERTGQRIGLPWLLAALAPVSDFGRRVADAFVPFLPGDEAAARAACERVVVVAQAFASDGVERIRAALRRAPDPTSIVARARAGDPLGDVDFYELGRFLDALAATSHAWTDAGGNAAEAPPALEALAGVLAPGRSALGFYLADAFDPRLSACRAAYADADARVQADRRRLAAALDALPGMSADGDEFIAMRDALPHVPPGLRVVRETSTYRTLALDLDDEALVLVAARERAFAQLAETENAARLVLAERIGANASAVASAVGVLGALDVLLARVALTRRFGGCAPAFDTERFTFADAVDAPLAEALQLEGLGYTPVSLDLHGAAVLTGPNMGGKSAALATCGFLALCCSLGVPPPAASYAGPLFAQIAWIGEGEREPRTHLLSSFGAEVVGARDALAGEGRPLLALVDEFARTTGPREGRALTIALVEALARRGHFALVATHFDGVARDANVAHFAIAGLGERTIAAGGALEVHAALDAVAKAMDYRIVPLAADARTPSDALAIAELLGLDAAIVERARTHFQADA